MSQNFTFILYQSLMTLPMGFFWGESYIPCRVHFTFLIRVIVIYEHKYQSMTFHRDHLHLLQNLVILTVIIILCDEILAVVVSNA